LNGLRVTFLAAAVAATAGVVFYLGSPVHAAKAAGTQPVARQAISSKAKAISQSMSLPLFFEANQGQSDPQVKFLARGSGYGLFLTEDEAVLQLRHASPGAQHLSTSSRFSVASSQPSSVIRMHLDGANSSARVSGASPLPGKSNYFVGNDPSQWRQNIPQFGRVQYQAVYPGIDLVYYGNQGQLEYDFRVAPGADPSQIALSFTGASARIISGNSADSGDLILATSDGDVRFHAPRIYQPATSARGSERGYAERIVAGKFRQLADNRIAFTLGDYDRSRELVIDPTLSYSTYIGGAGTESAVQVAVDSAGLIYLAGSTSSAYFFPAPINVNNPPIQNTLKGTANIFVAVINPTQPANEQLVYATYLGGSGIDTLAGIAVDSAFSIYLAGSTTSSNFPTTTNAFQTAPSTTGVNHGFLSKISFGTPIVAYGLTYSTYLSGNGVDTVTGLAIDPSCGQQACNAYVTGDTTSTDAASNYFPANPNGYQTASNAPANIPNYPQFFASKINTNGSGPLSMLYSTYFGGGNPSSPIAVGGGIAVDASGYMYFTGTTNMLPTAGPNGEAPFPLFASQQSCLNEASANTNCTPATSKTDAFVAKINPNLAGSDPLYSTYLGGSDNDTGVAIALDSSTDAFVTGSTFSTDWVCSCIGGFEAYAGGGDAYVAKLGALSGATYPLTYFTYLGGSGSDTGNAIQVDSLGAAHVAGNTTSPDFPQGTNALEPYAGGGDAFVALISSSLGGLGAGDYLTYLGGSGQDQGTSIALDIYGAAYVAGTTQSTDFPVTTNALQPHSGGGTDAFVSKIGAVSTLVVAASTTSPSPNPVAAGTQVAFIFTITNANADGTDPASQVVFSAQVSPSTGLASPPTAKLTGGTGNCGAVQANGTIQCFISTLAVGGVDSVEVDVTPSDTTTPVPSQVSVSGSASANGGPFQSLITQTVKVVDFTITASVQNPTINAGDPDTIQVNFCPTSASGYSATITPSDTILPSMVTATTPTFTPTTVTLSGSACAPTTLSIATVARPVNTGSLLRHGSLYVAWLPIGGLSLIGLGIGASRKRRRLLLGVLLCLVAGVILVQPGCGNSSTSTTTTGGTLAGQYTITIIGAAGTGASHSYPVTLTVH
jgi:hypothetical protein